MGANELLEEAEGRVGSVLKGKWSLDRLIGAGGTAAVYEAHHRNGSRVAVKVMHSRVARSAGQRVRFHTEGNAANRVGHPSVTVVHDDEVAEDGSPFLVMELLHGQTVAERAAERGGVLDPAEVLGIADRLLDVLVAAHANGVIHRDIKPQNLFLTDSGELKVLDFGIARHHDPSGSATSTEVGLVLGTPAFLPPEQARGRPDEIDARSDLWAVGATMYTLLTGGFVHEASTRNEQLGLAMMTAAPSLEIAGPTLPRPLIEVVDRALAYSREDRWLDARAMQAAVRWLRASWESLGDPALELPAAWTTRAPGSASADAGLVTLGPTVSRFDQRRPRRWTLLPLLLVGSVVAVVAIRLATTAPGGAGVASSRSSEPARISGIPTDIAAPPPQASLSAEPRAAPSVLPAARRAPAPERPPPRPAVAPVKAPRPSSSPPLPPEVPEPAARRKAVANPLDRRY